MDNRTSSLEWLNGNNHEQILTDICSALAERTGDTHIYKIPAHVGHPGNEAADATAKAAARAGPELQARGPEENPEHTHRYVPP